MGSILAALSYLALGVLGWAAILASVLEPSQRTGTATGGLDVGMMAAPSQLAAGPMV